MRAYRRRQNRFAPKTAAKNSYELDDDSKDKSVYSFLGDPRNREVIDPPERKRIPKDGAWIMITRRLPAIAGDLDRHIRVARIFYAEHEDGVDDSGFRPDGTYKVRIRSPWGEVSVWPYEYSKIDTAEIIAMWQADEIKFHPLNMELGRFNDIVFYARSRGIATADAMVMALGSIAGPVGWFEPREDLARAAEEMAAVSARFGRLTAVNHERRRAAQERAKREQ